MAHVPALDARSRVLRENIPDHCLLGFRCVGLTRTSSPLRGGVYDIRPSLEFGLKWPMCMLMKYYGGVSPWLLKVD
jgi:hypothetical protein